MTNKRIIITTGLYFLVLASALESEQVLLRAVRGRDAVLPCGQGKVFLDGPSSYVLWMKDNKEFLYRYPNEDTHSSITMEQAPENLEGDTLTEPTSLHLKRVGEHDAGMYRCRVHYQASPAVDFLIELRLVDSPKTPKIVNPDGFDLSGNIGLLNLGSNMTLICEIEDADDVPGTLLWWERNGVELARAGSVQNGVLRSTIRVTEATRSELDAHYVCLAQNADVTDPLTASLVVKMHLPPMSVEIRVNNNLDFEAGQPRVVDCVVVGCVPPPAVTWHLGGAMLRPTVHKELHDGNFTVSSLTLVPSLRDDKRELTCRAHNSHLPREVFEDKVNINVGYRPTCLQDQGEVIGYVEGQSERVTCTVEAYPEPIQFSWTFANSKTLYTSVRKVPGYQHRYSSSLTWKPRDRDEGELVCRATNVLGEQKKPCVYSVVEGGPPLTPDCLMMTTDPKTVTISCKKSWDGGRPQTIHLELKKNGDMVQNVTDNYGHFALPQFQERNITAVLYASNSRGRSDATVISLTPNYNYTALEEKMPLGSYLLQAAASTMAFATILCGLTQCIKSVQRKLGVPDSQSDPEEEMSTALGSDGTFHRQPEVQPLAQESPQLSPPHVIVRLPETGNYYSVAPSKATQLLSHMSPSPSRVQTAHVDPEAATTSYFV